LTDKGDGKYTFPMTGSQVTVTARFKQTDTGTENPFTDISKNDYFYDAVLWAVEEGITSGTSDTTFSPNVSCTRAQMVTFLWRVSGFPKASITNPFTDVSADAYYYDAVLWAVEQGITGGTYSRLAYIGGEIKYINETKALIIEYLKDKREMLDKVPDWTAESLRLQQIIHGEQEELKKRLADVNRNIFKIDAELKELKEANRKALENREEYHRSTLLDWFTSRESIFSSMNRTDTDGDCRSLVREITIRVSEQSQKLSELRKEITAYTGNFSEDNVFAFKTSFSDDKEYMDFACDLKEFIDEDKVSEYQSRINTRNSDIFRQITADTKSMVSQEGNIRGVVDQINADFKEKNFVGIIQCIEMRIDPSQNKIVNLLKEIKRFNEEYSWDLGQNLFASSADDTATREKATTLLRELIKSMDAYSGNLIRLADFFDLKFRVIENRNDTGFVERLTNVGSEGTDILVKSMVNIMLLNVFKRNASTVFSDFRLHCMMDEIGKLHPNNVAGILKFANDRDILLINGSPTEQDALSYKHIYKLEKDTDSFTRIRRVITQFD